MQIIRCESREQWLSERTRRVMASEAASIMRLSPWVSPVEVAQRKLGLVPEVEDNPAMEWGRRLEPVIRGAYAEKHGVKVLYDGPFTIVAHPSLPMGASLDGVVNDAEGEAVLEIKCSREPWSEVPLYYQAQVQHQMVVTGLERAVVVALFGGRDLQEFQIKRHPAFQELLIRREVAFWDLVSKGQTPEAITDEDVLAQAKGLLGVDPRREVVLAPELLALHEERLALRRVLSKTKKDLDQIRSRFIVAMGDAHLGKIEGSDVEYTSRLVKRAQYTVKATEYRDLRSSADRAAADTDD